MPRIAASTVPRLLPYLEAGLAPAASAEQYAGALIVATQLASRAPLAEPLTEALLEGVAKGARAPLRAQALQALLALCQTQAVQTLPSRAFKHLVKLPDLPSHVTDLCERHRADALATPLVRALASSATQHANYERVLNGVVSEVPLSAASVTALVRELVTLATSAEGTPARTSPRERFGSSTRDTPRRVPRRWTPSYPNHRPRLTRIARVARLISSAGRFRVRRRGPCPGTPLRSARRWTTRNRDREAALRELRQSGAGAKAMAAGASSPARFSAASSTTTRASPPPPRRSRAFASPSATTPRLFDAAAERLATAAGGVRGEDAAGGSGTRRRETVRATRRGHPSTPRPTEANGTGETDETGGSSDDDDDDDEDETEKEKKDVGVGVGALAGRGAALALGHLIFSPSTRAVARATVEAARRNAHPSLAGVRGDAFAKAMEVANAASGAASPAAPAKRGGAKDRSKTSATVSKPDKESRARADAACNAAVFAALAEGFAAGANAWGGADALRVWTLEAWRDGTPRGRGALLLALRAAVVAADGTPGGCLRARRALGTPPRDVERRGRRRDGARRRRFSARRDGARRRRF